MRQVLPSERNTATTERIVLRAARAQLNRRKLSAVFEHGHWWVTDPSGAIWDAVDTDRGFAFELVSTGDEL